MKYSDKLRDPRWQKKRLEVLNRDEFTCQLCYDQETELQLHHKGYGKGLEPWEYPLENFITYCKHCHRIAEAAKTGTATLIQGHKIIGDMVAVIFVAIEDKGRFAVKIFDYYEEDNSLNEKIAIGENRLIEMLELLNKAKIKYNG